MSGSGVCPLAMTIALHLSITQPSQFAIGHLRREGWGWAPTLHLLRRPSGCPIQYTSVIRVHPGGEGDVPSGKWVGVGALVQEGNLIVDCGMGETITSNQNFIWSSGNIVRNKSSTIPNLFYNL